MRRAARELRSGCRRASLREPAMTSSTRSKGKIAHTRSFLLLKFIMIITIITIITIIIVIIVNVVHCHAASPVLVITFHHHGRRQGWAAHQNPEGVHVHEHRQVRRHHSRAPQPKLLTAADPQAMAPKVWNMSLHHAAHGPSVATTMKSKPNSGTLEAVVVHQTRGNAWREDWRGPWTSI